MAVGTSSPSLITWSPSRDLSQKQRFTTRCEHQASDYEPSKFLGGFSVCQAAEGTFFRWKASLTRMDELYEIGTVSKTE